MPSGVSIINIDWSSFSFSFQYEMVVSSAGILNETDDDARQKEKRKKTNLDMVH